MSADTILIPEIVVTGSRISVTTKNLPLSVSVVTSAQLENRMEQSILPLLMEQSPSLFITSRGVMGYGVAAGSAGAMTMRGVGGSGGQILALIDGHPQFMGLMGHPIADSYQNIMTERVEVVRGPASVLYGSNALGGVVNIITRRQQEDGINTHIRTMYGSYNTVSAEAVNTIRKKDFNSVFSLGYNRSDGHRPNMNFEQFSGYGKVGYDFSPNWKSFIDLNLSQINSSNPGLITTPLVDNDMEILRGISSFSLQNDYGISSGALKLFYNFGQHYINDGYNPNAPTNNTPRQNRFNSRDWMLGFNLFQNYSFFNDNQTTFGIDYQRYGGHAWNSFVNGNPDVDIIEETVDNFAAYMNFQQLFAQRLMFNAGIRYDYHSLMGGEWIPQIGLNYFAGENTTLKAIVSKGYRTPSIRELYFLFPNPDLKSESLMNYEIALNQYFLDRKIRLDANLYYIKGKNSIILTPNAPNIPPFIWQNTGKLENYGLELAVRYRISSNLSVNSNYSYLYMKNPVLGSPEYKLYIGVDYRLNRWNFSAGMQYVHNLTLAIATNPNIIDTSNTESFTLWNARVSYQLTSFMNLNVRAENLFNESYKMYTGYPMPGTTVFGGFTMRI
jgi:iron complex outermembrane receptor protein